MEFLSSREYHNLVLRLEEIRANTELILYGEIRSARREERIMTNLTAISAAVEHVSSVDESVKALVTQLVQEIKDAGTDQTALDNLTARLEAGVTDIATFVVANTPVTPPPAPEPVPDPTPAPEPTPEPEPAPADGDVDTDGDGVTPNDAAAGNGIDV